MRIRIRVGALRMEDEGVFRRGPLSRSPIVAGDLDPPLLTLLRSLRSLCVCVWCWAQAVRTVEIDEAARHHLSRLRAER